MFIILSLGSALNLWIHLALDSALMLQVSSINTLSLLLIQTWNFGNFITVSLVFNFTYEIF